MSSNKENVKRGLVNGFGSRLRQSFEMKSNAQIARILGVTDAAVNQYMKGRVPAADKLIEISNLTGCDLHWLLTGEDKPTPKFKASRTKTLLFQGGKGGVGTTAAAMMASVILAGKGFRTLLVGNNNSIDSLLFSLHRGIYYNSEHSSMTLTQDTYTTTSIDNLELFIKKGTQCDKYPDIKLQRFNKKQSQIQTEYDFIVFDVQSFETSYHNFRTATESLLFNQSLIIPYQPANSTTMTVEDILGAINQSAIDFEKFFLGLFINNERPTLDKPEDKYYLERKIEITKRMHSKVFKSVVRYDFDGFENFIRNTDIDELKKTQLFLDYSDLVDEILEKLSVERVP